MAEKIHIPDGETPPPSQIGATLESLISTIEDRRGAGSESYTHRLLTGNEDTVLKKVIEEAGEVVLAAKDASRFSTQPTKEDSIGTSPDPSTYDAAVDHLRYEAADVVYHLLVVLVRYGIPLDEFAAELNTRMTEAERPDGAVCLFDEYVKRGK